MKDIYELELHEQEYVAGGDMKVVRVPGGWIYKTFGHDGSINGTFVPFDNEFMASPERTELK